MVAFGYFPLLRLTLRFCLVGSLRLCLVACSLCIAQMAARTSRRKAHHPEKEEGEDSFDHQASRLVGFASC